MSGVRIAAGIAHLKRLVDFVASAFLDVEACTCLLATKKVDHVVLSGDYRERFRTGELSMLGPFARSGLAEEEFRGDDGTIAYRIRPPESAWRDSLRSCGL